MRTTVGQLLVNRTLPEDMRDYSRTLDKKQIKKLLGELAQKYPDEYRRVSHQLSEIGHRAAYTSGGNSFGLKHMLKARAAKAIQQKIRADLREIMADESLTDDERDAKIVTAVGKYSSPMQKAVLDESLAEQNPLARQVSSGSRGSPLNLASLRGSDLLYTDHRDRVLPIPVLRSYSEGLTPLEYWAGTYGARKGVIDTKFATQDAGYLSKQLNQIAHRALVTALDADKESPTLRGFPVDTSDEDSEGSLLAYDAGGYKRNTVLTPKILDDLNRKGVKRILVRSPAVGGPADGGVYARDAGIREFGRLPTSGENIGMAAAQAISEPLSQAQLSSKHAGGVAGAEASQAVSGFDYINQLVQVPRQFKSGAAHSSVDGLVQRIEDGPAGGKYAWIENEKHFIGKDYKPLIRRGDKVEAGDVISEGIPNPAIIVKHKGIGEGRRYFINAMRQAFRDAGITTNRRNLELLSRGLIDHVRLLDEIGDYAPDDVVPYSRLEAGWKPRAGYQTVSPKQAVGRYLERPYLHYSIGDRVRTSMLRDFEDFGIKEVDVHEEEPPFQAEMIRGMSNLQHDPDWVTRMFGSGQKKSVLDAVHRGGSSNMTGTSFVPGLAHGVNFGQIGKIQLPEVSQTKIGQFSRQAAMLLEKRAEDYLGASTETAAHSLLPGYGGMSQQDAVRADQVQAIRHILNKIRDRQKYWNSSRRQAAGELEGTVDPTTGKVIWDVANQAKWFVPKTWPLAFTSGGSYAPIVDEFGYEWDDAMTRQYHQSAKYNNPEYSGISGRSALNEQYAIHDSNVPQLASLTLPESGIPDLGSEGMRPVPNMTAAERADWLKFMDNQARPDNPGDWGKAQYSPRGQQIMNTLSELYPEAYQAAYDEVWSPQWEWETRTPLEREALLRHHYQSNNLPDPAPHRSWQSLAQSEEVPLLYTQEFYPEWLAAKREKARAMAASSDPGEAEMGTRMYLDMMVPNIPGDVVNNDAESLAEFYSDPAGATTGDVDELNQAVLARVQGAYSRGDISREEAQQFFNDYRQIVEARKGAQQPATTAGQIQQPQPQPQQQQPQQVTPPAATPNPAGAYPNSNQVPRQVPRQVPQPAPTRQRPQNFNPPTAAELKPLAPRDDMVRRRPQFDAKPMANMLRTGLAMNPQASQQFLRNAGPLGVGAFGLLVAPNRTMSLFGSRNTRQNMGSMPKIQQPPKAPQPPKIEPPKQPQPPKPPGGGIGGSDMVPG